MCNTAGLSFPAMNLTHTAAAAAAATHRGFGVHVSAPNPLGMTPGSYSTPTGLHQRSPFAIQELLGLGQAQDTARNPISTHNDSVMSASSYAFPRTLQTPGTPGAAAQGACLTMADHSNATPHSYSFSTWRPNFMAFSGNHAQSMLNLGAAQAHMAAAHADSNTGK